MLLSIEIFRIFQSESTLYLITGYMKDYRLSREKIAELEKFHRFLCDKRQPDCVKAIFFRSDGWC